MMFSQKEGCTISRGTIFRNVMETGMVWGWGWSQEWYIAIVMTYERMCKCEQARGVWVHVPPR